MKKAGIGVLFVLMVIVSMTLGCTSQKSLKFDVGGLVEKPGTYDLYKYQDKFVTINAKLDGKVTHLPEQQYTGVPLRVVLSEAGVGAGATNVTVSASDGYSQKFELANVTANDNLILINENETVRLVAKGYAGGMWVESVTKLDVS